MWHSWNGSQKHGKGAVTFENRSKNEDLSNDSIAEIDQNIEKSPGDQKGFDVCLSDSSENPPANDGLKLLLGYQW